jgi:hypothetical protein
MKMTSEVLIMLKFRVISRVTHAISESEIEETLASYGLWSKCF